MTYNWNQAFESYPPGSYRGSTMGEGLRRNKAAFYERFIVEHEITEGATPTAVHRLGECGVVQMVPAEDTPLSNYVEGALQYHPPGIYWDDGSALQHAIPLDHGEYDGLSDDDHPQYLKVSGGSVSGDLHVDAVTNSSTTATSYISSYPNRLLNKGAHEGVDASSLSYHDNYLYTSLSRFTNKSQFLLNTGEFGTNVETDTFEYRHDTKRLLGGPICTAPTITSPNAADWIYFAGVDVDLSWEHQLLMRELVTDASGLICDVTYKTMDL